MLKESADQGALSADRIGGLTGYQGQPYRAGWGTVKFSAAYSDARYLNNELQVPALRLLMCVHT